MQHSHPTSTSASKVRIHKDSIYSNGRTQHRYHTDITHRTKMACTYLFKTIPQTLYTTISHSLQSLCSPRYIYVVSIHEQRGDGMRSNNVGTFLDPDIAINALDECLRELPASPERIWRRYMEVEDGETGMVVQGLKGYDALGLVEKMRVL